MTTLPLTIYSLEHILAPQACSICSNTTVTLQSQVIQTSALNEVGIQAIKITRVGTAQIKCY